MVRRIYLWLPGLIALGLSACSGSDTGFFSPVMTAGAGGSSYAGATARAGSTSSSGSPGSAAGANNPSAGSAGRTTDGGGGTQTAGGSSGGASSGGANSTGGVAGRAAAGAGGSVASAGHAGKEGGSAGAAGANQDPTCSELIKQANQQLEAARECNLAADSLQCTGKVTNQCGCQVPVQRTDSAATRAYQKTLKLLDEKDCIIACTAIACASVNNAQCRASDNGAMGTCVSSSRGPTL